MKMVVETVKELEYLHEKQKRPLIYTNFKSFNIT